LWKDSKGVSADLMGGEAKGRCPYDITATFTVTYLLRRVI